MKLVSLRRRSTVEPLAWVALAQPMGALESVFTATDAGSWYAMFARPWSAPPNWVFGPVWVTLFTLTGVVAWPVSRRDHPRRERVLAIFIGHLVVNVARFVALLGLRSSAVGLAVIVVLLAVILAMTREFAAVNRRAAALLVPYLLWMCFATAFNYGLWSLGQEIR